MNVDAYVWGALSFLFEELQHRVLRVVARIFRERLGNREQRLGIRLHAKLGTPRHLSLVLDQVGVRKRLEAARAGEERLICTKRYGLCKLPTLPAPKTVPHSSGR